MRFFPGVVTILFSAYQAGSAPSVTPAPQRFRQEIAHQFTEKEGIPTNDVRLVECGKGGTVRAFAGGKWYQHRDGKWQVSAELSPTSEREFAFADGRGQRVNVGLSWADIRQIL